MTLITIPPAFGRNVAIAKIPDFTVLPPVKRNIAFGGGYVSYEVKHVGDSKDYLRYLDAMIEQVLTIFPDSPTKFSIGLHMTFTKDGETITPKFPVTMNSDVLESPRTRLLNMRNEIIGIVDGYTQQSNLVIESIKKSYINLYKHNFVQGSSYQKLPPGFSTRSGIINPENKDECCFYWACVLALYEQPPGTKNPGRITAELKKFAKKNFPCVVADFPMIITEDEGRIQKPHYRIAKYEKIFNRKIHIWGLNKGEPIPIRSSEGPYEKHILLLYWKEHFALVKNESAFFSRFASSDGHKVFMCYRCCSPQFSEMAHAIHKRDCQGHSSARVEMPKPDEYVEFKDYSQLNPLPVVIYADGESIQTQTECTHKGRWCGGGQEDGFCPQHPSQNIANLGEQLNVSMGMVVYDRIIGRAIHKQIFKGESAVRDFIEAVKEWAEWTHERYFLNIKKMKGRVPYSKDCCLCLKPLKDDTVRHHCHFTGKPIGYAHNACNLNCKVKPVIPVVFHNGKGYDNHFIIRELLKEDMKSVKVLPDNFEKWKAFSLLQTNEDHVKPTDPSLSKYRYVKGSFDIVDSKGTLVEDPDLIEKVRADMKIRSHNRRCNYQVRFIDSLLFMNPGDSLDSVTKGMADDDFHVTRTFAPDDNKFKLLRKKGVMPYEYMDSLERFKETQLPPIEAFVSRLQHGTQDFNKLSVKEKLKLKVDYKHAQLVWDTFGCVTMEDYHDLYLNTDCHLLCDMMEAYRETFLEGFRIDPFHKYTLPGAAWQAMLLKTGVKIPLIQSQEMYMFIEKGLRGGVSFVGTKRYMEANNPHVPHYDAGKPHSWMLYIDMNSLYAHVMKTMKLPHSNIKWEETVDLHADCSGDKGYIVEVDKYLPDEFHDSCKEYPGAPEAMEVPVDWYSPLQMMTSITKKSQGVKLVPNLHKKERYVVHLETLQQYMKQGWVVTKVHRAVSFTQRTWMKPYIEYCIDKRAASKTDFHKDFWKLLCNAVFGKTMQNVRGYRDVHIIKATQQSKYMRFIHSPGFMRGGHVEKLSDDFYVAERKVLAVKLDQPIFVGLSILDLSKLAMHRFWYEQLVPRYGDKLTLVYTDTDSFIFSVETPNVYTDLLEPSFNAKFDFSNIKSNHPIPEIAALANDSRKKQDGLMKIEDVKIDDDGNKRVCVISRVVALRPKMYGIESVGGQFENKAKGVPKKVCKSFAFDDYMKSLHHEGLRTSMAQTHSFHRLSVRHHRIYLEKHTKITLGCFTDKSYLLEDGITQVPYGHYSLRKRKWDEIAQDEFLYSA